MHSENIALFCKLCTEQLKFTATDWKHATRRKKERLGTQGVPVMDSFPEDFLWDFIAKNWETEERKKERKKKKRHKSGTNYKTMLHALLLLLLLLLLTIIIIIIIMSWIKVINQQ